MKTLSALALSIVVCSFVFASDPPMETPAGTTQTPTWVKYTVPTDDHKLLKDFAGQWTYTMQWWNTPETKPEVSKGTSRSKMIMGGRFLDQDVTAKMKGKKFEGMGITGFDTLRQEYQSIWFDNMSTHIATTTGTFNTTTNTLKESGTMACAMTENKNRPFRTELHRLSKNEHTFTMYTQTPEGNEFKMAVINYKRVN